MGPTQEFNGRDHVGQGLATTGLGSTKDVSAIQDVRYGPGLNLSSLWKTKSGHRLLGLLGQRQLTKLDSREVFSSAFT